ncbi:hypothetical protein CLOP_g15710 [Closterium sp. NIES-67]|nr:hypothetical protein CLOP_g15710 [Closterium sp. NIES-67]
MRVPVYHGQREERIVLRAAPVDASLGSACTPCLFPTLLSGFRGCFMNVYIPCVQDMHYMTCLPSSCSL